MSRDPIGERGGINIYRFVQNDPIRKLDSLGDEMWLASAARSEQDAAFAVQEVNKWNAKIEDRKREVKEQMAKFGTVKFTYEWRYRSMKAPFELKIDPVDEDTFFKRLGSEKVNLVPLEFKSLHKDMVALKDIVQNKHSNPWDSTAYFFHTEDDGTVKYKYGSTTSEQVRKEFFSSLWPIANAKGGGVTFCSCEVHPDPSLGFVRMNAVNVDAAEGDVSPTHITQQTKKVLACVVRWHAGRLVCLPAIGSIGY